MEDRREETRSRVWLMLGVSVSRVMPTWAPIKKYSRRGEGEEGGWRLWRNKRGFEERGGNKDDGMGRGRLEEKRGVSRFKDRLCPRKPGRKI